MVNKANELVKRDMGRDLGAELLQSVREMKAGQGNAIGSFNVHEVVEARTRTGLSQSSFAVLMGVSVRTLQDWEQGRREPSGAAKTLLQIAKLRPEVLVEIAQ